MRVLHLIKGLGPGGAERLLVSLTEARSEHIEVDVAYVLSHKDHLVAELEEVGGTAHLLGGPGGLHDLRWLARLLRLVRERRPDVVHLHSPAVAAMARPVLRMLHPRLVLISTEHNQWASFSRVTRIANACTLPLDDVRLAVSEEVRRSAWRGWRGSTTVLIHGIPVQRLMARRSERAAARRDLGIDEDDIVVTTIANLREKKDYPTLLAAAERAIAIEPRLRFLAVGHGPLEHELTDRHAALGLGDRFTFLGYQPDPARVLAASDIFTLTSRHEGLSIALLEALALGVPAVTSRAGGIVSVLEAGGPGVLVPVGAVEEFATSYVALARDDDRRRTLGDLAGERAAHFDIATTQLWLEERYATAANRHRSPKPAEMS